MTHHFLYRMFSLDDELLYVGITLDPSLRFRDHRNKKDWWPEVAKITLEHFDSRKGAADAERAAVRHESPVFNSIRFNETRVSKTPPVVTIATLRKALGLTLQDVCDHINREFKPPEPVERGTISAIENGHCDASAQMLAGIASALGVSLDDIDTQYQPRKSRHIEEVA